MGLSWSNSCSLWCLKAKSSYPPLHLCPTTIHFSLHPPLRVFSLSTYSTILLFSSLISSVVTWYISLPWRAFNQDLRYLKTYNHSSLLIRTITTILYSLLLKAFNTHKSVVLIQQWRKTAILFLRYFIQRKG